MLKEARNQTSSTRSKDKVDRILRHITIIVGIAAVIVAILDVSLVMRRTKNTFMIYEVAKGREVRLRPNSSGEYVLKPDTIYDLRWDTSCLRLDEEGKFNIGVMVYADFLIEESGKGSIDIETVDYLPGGSIHHETLDITSSLGDLSIEFYADHNAECPAVYDNELRCYFYTSGNFIPYEFNDHEVNGGKLFYHYAMLAPDWPKLYIITPDDHSASPDEISNTVINDGGAFHL